MQSRSPVRGASLADQVLDILVDRIRSGDYPPESQLPPEHDLAAEFNVSRATVRTAISTLAARGLVVRRQGVGTFTSQLSGISNPLNEASDFHHLITSSGYTSGAALIRAEITVPEPGLADLLQLQPGQAVLQSHKVFTADYEPVIYCINSIPSWVLGDSLTEEATRDPGLTGSLYEYLEQHGQRVEYHIARLKADVVQNCAVCLPLPYSAQTPMLVMEEVGYNDSERPIFHSTEYFPGDHIRFELVRRRGPIS